MPQQWAPLVFVLLFEAVLVVMEDLKRHEADNVENNRPTKVLDEECKSWSTVSWKDVKVGQVIAVADNEMAPADIIVLQVKGDSKDDHDGSDEGDSTFYVETKNLDGETNLKVRNALQLSVHQPLRVECENPNTETNRFTGRVVLTDSKATANSTSVTVSIANVILRGTVLRNSGDFDDTTPPASAVRHKHGSDLLCAWLVAARGGQQLCCGLLDGVGHG